MGRPTPRNAFRFLQWYLFFFIPRQISGSLMRTAPVLQYTSTDETSIFVSRLKNVNVGRPTKFCRVMTKHGSDKGRRWHNYTTVYSALFGAVAEKPLRIFELGLGTNDPSLVSSMGITGRPGASLRGWRELFPAARVYGADVDRKILFREDRIDTFYCDQLDRNVIKSLWDQPDLKAGVDLLIEDGLHTFEANVSFLESSLEHVRPAGTYVIEDIDTGKLDAWRDLLRTKYVNEHPDFEFALISLPNSANAQDNNMLIARRNEKAAAPRAGFPGVG